MPDLEKIAAAKRRWYQEKKLNELPPAYAENGQPLSPVYTPDDLLHFDYLRDLGFPGEYPFTRGVYPGMYRKGPWQMRLYAGFGTAEDTNRRWKFLLKAGNMGVACAFDLPTQIGLDSDDPQATDEVGRVGVAIDTLRDMEILYDELPLDQIASSFNINTPAATILAMYLALAEKQGVPLAKLRGTISNDMLCEYISRGTWVFPPGPALKMSTDIVEFCTHYLPHFYPYNIRGIIIREAGASMVQEGAYALANALAYIEEALKRNLAIDDFAHHLSFFFATGLQIFEEAARYRALRRLWAKTMKDQFGAKNPQSMLLRFTGTVGGSTYRAQEPENNLVRGAYGLLANILGGAQGMLQPAMDEAFAIPTEHTARLALRTQQILAYETGITKVADPLGGAYYVETLTNSLETMIKEEMDKISALGGAVRAIELGYPQKVIAEEAYRVAKEEETGQRIVVGVNKFRVEEEERALTIHQPDEQGAARQIQRIREVKKVRDGQTVKKALDELCRAAEKNENLMPYFIAAVKTYATVGEITEALKKVYGIYQEPAIF
ncbi:MAG: acyl-CoA mutase large subunit family protein [Thermodesulfobacteriota bacterium]